MEKYNELVSRLEKCFRKSGLDYAFTGALAVSFYAIPRTTSDVDIMVAIEAKEEAKKKIVETLNCAGLEANLREIERALSSGYCIASFKDKATAYSVDVILTPDKIEKQVGEIAGITAYFQKPEDLIVAKLRMIKATVPPERASKDVDDIKAIMAFTKVNKKKLKQKAKKAKALEVFEKLVEHSIKDAPY